MDPKPGPLGLLAGLPRNSSVGGPAEESATGAQDDSSLCPTPSAEPGPQLPGLSMRGDEPSASLLSYNKCRSEAAHGPALRCPSWQGPIPCSGLPRNQALGGATPLRWVCHPSKRQPCGPAEPSASARSTVERIAFGNKIYCWQDQAEWSEYNNS